MSYKRKEVQYSPDELNDMWIMEEQAPALESFIPLPFLPSVFISASLSITLQADYFISKASIMNNVSFFSSFFSWAFCTLWFSLWPCDRLVGYFWSSDHGGKNEGWGSGIE